MIEAGTILQNRYRVEKQIGQGGMGNVYVATDERFNSVVAIKETIFEDANLRRAFEREARLLNSLKHAALPRVSDHFDENEGQFLVMEYIAGDDLAAMMEKNGAAFPLETVLNWARQLCAALEYLHAQNIIHRDIKPQNLKLTPQGEIVLLDFGLAKGSAIDAAHQTAAKSIFGFSRNYASLEQIQGAGTEPRSDLYSLSATLYHLLTGIPPADALTRAMNVLNKHSDPLIPANAVNGHVPRGVAEILQKAMALNADERPASAAEMREMLDESDQTVDGFAPISANNLLTADFLAQETKIIGAKTNLSNDAESEAATITATNNPTNEKSFKTSVAESETEATIQRSPVAAPKRRKTIGAVALGGLILLGTVFSAGYFLNGDSAPSKVNAENSNAEIPNNFSVTAKNANVADGDNSNAEIPAERETTAKPQPESPIQSPGTPENNAKSAKKQTPNAPPAKSSEQNADQNNFVIGDDKIELGDVIIDDNGIRDRKTGKLIISDEAGDGSKSLTPEQIRRLKKLGEAAESNKKRVVIVKPPTAPTVPPVPQTTPEQPK